MELGVVVGVIVIGFVHGVLPDHGWPIAAMYALNRNRRLLYGLLAALILGVGHLISSVVLVLAYFWFSAFAEFAEGPWMRYVAGALLILLGIHEYRNGGHGHVHEHDDHEHGHDGHGHAGHEHGHDGHGHAGHEHGHDGHGHAGHEHGHDGHGHAGHEHGHDSHGHSGHEHTDHSHEHGHPNDADVHHGHDHSDDGEDGLLERIRAFLPGGGGHQHLSEEHAERGLAALGTTALLLGFAHEEPIQILAICVGTEACLELMLIYSLAVIVAIVLPTLLLIAGYEHHRERVEKLTPYLPTITAVVLIAMGLAFIVGLV